MREELIFSSRPFCGIGPHETRCQFTATTLAIAGIVLAAAGAGAGAYTAVSSGKAQEEASKYNAQVQKNNALTASRQAKYESDRIAKRNRIIKGKQQAGYAKAGIDLSGSAEDVILDSAIEGELDRQAALYSGATAAQSAIARSRLDEFEGRSARRAGYVRAGGAILSGGSQGVETYSRYRASQEPEFN